MVKPFDLSKLRKQVSSKAKIEAGWHDPHIWLDTGNYALNKMISGSFFKGIPFGKVTVFAGESGSGKSYVVSGSLVKNALTRDMKVILLDSEFALDKEWVGKFYDVDEDDIDRYPVSTIDDCAKIVNELMDVYREAVDGFKKEDYPPILLVIDSLGMLSTPTEEDQFSKGDLKGDMGRKAKQLKAFVTQCLKMFGPYPIALVATNHTYKSQDMFNPDDVISGGSGFMFASSIIVAMQKLKLKQDEEGNKIGEVRGIRSKMKCMKTRYAKPFEEVEVQIPYTTGMSPYSGLFDMFVKTGVIYKSGNKWEYIDKDGEVHKHFEKEWNKRHDVLMRIMKEIDGEDIGPDNLVHVISEEDQSIERE